MLGDPEVLFLDEPTAGLDPVATREVHELIVGLRERGVTTIIRRARGRDVGAACGQLAGAYRAREQTG